MVDPVAPTFKYSLTLPTGGKRAHVWLKVFVDMTPRIDQIGIWKTAMQV